MATVNINPIPLARYRFTCRMQDAVRLPALAGSTLRGAFGHALRQLSCMTKARECTGCMLLAQCPFPALFAPHELPKPAQQFSQTIQQIPVPYVIEPPLDGARTLEPGDSFQFHMVLVGNALSQLPLIIMAWQRALARGITSRRSKASVECVEWLAPNKSPHLVYNHQSGRVIEHTAALALPDYATAEDVHIQLLTPLHIESNKQTLGPRKMHAGVLLRHLLRRISLVMQYHCPTATGLLPSAETVRSLNAMADTIEDERRLTWQDGKRYSSRQQKEIPLGGISGHWLLKQVPPPLLAYLYIGQWLHAGKETAFGLGQYEISNTPWFTTEEKA